MDQIKVFSRYGSISFSKDIVFKQVNFLNKNLFEKQQVKLVGLNTKNENGVFDLIFTFQCQAEKAMWCNISQQLLKPIKKTINLNFNIPQYNLIIELV